MSDVVYYQAVVTKVGNPRASNYGKGMVIGLDIQYQNGETETIWSGPDQGQEWEAREFMYTKVLRPGMQVTVKSRPRRDGQGTVQTVAVPEEFQAFPVEPPPYMPSSPVSPPPQSPQLSPISPVTSPMSPVPSAPTPQAPPPAPEEPPPAPTRPALQRQGNGGGTGYAKLTDAQRMAFMMTMEDVSWMWETAVTFARKAVTNAGLEVTDTKIAEIATTYLIERPIWRVEQLNVDLLAGQRLPLTVGKLRKAIARKMEDIDGRKKPSEEQMVALRAGLSKLFPNDEQRHKVCVALVGQPSTKEMVLKHVSPLLDWIDADKENDYEPNPATRIEAQALVDAYG